MSFHLAAQEIRVDEGHILRAKLHRADGSLADAEVDLNQYLGNNDGRFQWGGQNFGLSAENVRFNLEGVDNVPILRAVLSNAAGEKVEADVNLAEFIGNNDGGFFFQG